MKERDIYFELEGVTIRLDMITQTITALDAAMSAGDYKLGSNSFSLPCGMLSDISKKISELVEELFEVSGKEDKIA